MRRQTSIHIRIPNEQVGALDAAAGRAGQTRPAFLRDALQQVLDVQLIQHSAHAAMTDALDHFRAEARAAQEQLVASAKASDATNRDLIARFLDALATVVTPKPVSPTKRA